MEKKERSLCFFLHHAKTDVTPYFVKIYIDFLSKHFDEVHVAANGIRPSNNLEFSSNVTWSFHQNFGYDLGLFIELFNSIDPSIYHRIACINDSNVCLNRLDHVFDWAENKSYDFWGMIDSYEQPHFSTHKDSYHIQSHFLVFEKAAIALIPKFLEQLSFEEVIRVIDLKSLRRNVINHWEIGLSQFFLNEGLQMGSFISSDNFNARFHRSIDANSTIKLPKELLSKGFPLLKLRVLKTKNKHIVDNWESTVRNCVDASIDIEKLISELIDIDSDRSVKPYRVSGSTVSMFVHHYKNQIFDIFPENYYQIWCGKNGKTEPSKLIGDDTGDNISERNNNYSELTGIYWMWKNSNADVVGSLHYRRFFTVNQPFIHEKILPRLYWLIGGKKKRYGLYYASSVQRWIPNVLSAAQIQMILKTYDAIMPRRRTLRYSVEEHYRRCHNIDDLNLLRDIIEECHPDYITNFNEVLKDSKLYANNTFVLRNQEFNELMEWLFDILFEFERRADMKQYTGYQRRIFGFLSERLITIWLHKANLNTLELPLVYFKNFKPRKEQRT